MIIEVMPLAFFAMSFVLLKQTVRIVLHVNCGSAIAPGGFGKLDRESRLAVGAGGVCAGEGDVFGRGQEKEVRKLLLLRKTICQ
jgi:hypothetical protein